MTVKQKQLLLAWFGLLAVEDVDEIRRRLAVCSDPTIFTVTLDEEIM